MWPSNKQDSILGGSLSWIFQKALARVGPPTTLDELRSGVSREGAAEKQPDWGIDSGCQVCSMASEGAMSWFLFGLFFIIILD